jgi:hypothetical protein
VICGAECGIGREFLPEWSLPVVISQAAMKCMAGLTSWNVTTTVVVSCRFISDGTSRD